LRKFEQPEVPFCWYFFLEDLEAVTILLSHATHPPELTDPDAFLRPVPLMLASIWETFHIRCATEAAQFLAGFCKTAEDLPKELKKVIASEVKQDKNDLSPWELSGEGWRKSVRERVQSDKIRLGSGKSSQVDSYYLQAIGLRDLSKHWRDRKRVKATVATRLNDFIKRRDVITHRGDGFLDAEQCWAFRQVVIEQTIRTIHLVNQHVVTHSGTKFCEASMSRLDRSLRET
jgi:hypothetical protein